MTKRQRDEYQDRADLQDAGWAVEKRDAIAFNGGSETTRHVALKAIAGKVLRDHDYRVSSEVTHEDYGEIDVLGYGGDGPPFAVEIETNPNREVVDSKLDRYVRSNDVIRECFVLPAEDAPSGFEAAYEWVDGRLF